MRASHLSLAARHRKPPASAADSGINLPPASPLTHHHHHHLLPPPPTTSQKTSPLTKDDLTQRTSQPRTARQSVELRHASSKKDLFSGGERKETFRPVNPAVIRSDVCSEVMGWRRVGLSRQLFSVFSFFWMMYRPISKTTVCHLLLQILALT